MKQDTHALHALISRYFDGLTTLREEQRLRRLLARQDPTTSDPFVRGAMAVMGFYAASPPPRVTRATAPQPSSFHWWAVAASVGALLAVGALVTGLSDRPLAQTPDHCVAWVGGRQVADPSEVTDIIRADLSAVAYAASASAEPWEDAAQAWE